MILNNYYNSKKLIIANAAPFSKKMVVTFTELLLMTQTIMEFYEAIKFQAV